MTARLTRNRIWQLSYGLNERDLALVKTLAVVKVASVAQLERLHFEAQTRTCRRVLQNLAERRVVARLGRTVGGVRAGSSGHVYALDVVGQSLAADVQPTPPGRLRRPWTPGARFLDHALAVTDVYVSLMGLSARGAVEPMVFEMEPECWREFAPLGAPVTLKPDAFMRIGYRAGEDSYFVEVDRRTESLRTIEAKAAVYWSYFVSGEEQERHGVFPRVLWTVPNPQRQQDLQAFLKAGKTEAPRLHEVILQSEVGTYLEAQS